MVSPFIPILCFANNKAGLFGYCALTGTQVRDLRTGRPLANYSEVTFWMSDGSLMKVAFDKSVADSISIDNYADIMEAVRRGWQQEINRKKWKPKDIQDYKDKYFNLAIKEIAE